MIRGLALVTASVLVLGGCTDLSDGQQRSLTGGAAGAATGALIGALGGNAALGAGIGGATGLAGGFLYNHYVEAQEDAFRQGYEAGVAR